MKPTSQYSSEPPQGMMSEHAYILKSFGTILLGVILYKIIRTWLAKRKNSQRPVQQQRLSEYSSDIPGSTLRYASHRPTGDPAEADSLTSGRTHQGTSLEDAELAAFFELVGDTGLDTFFLSERCNGINRVDESVSDDRTNMHH